MLSRANQDPGQFKFMKVSSVDFQCSYCGYVDGQDGKYPTTVANIIAIGPMYDPPVVRLNAEKVHSELD